ncbi:hypothetical protein R84981_001240 [Carnimonas sp. R-84981]|uniref:hypothetical protein n=1 Tax=Carnimonas bestiolae TaxID=3402172 RepID=UPI003EDC009A
MMTNPFQRVLRLREYRTRLARIHAEKAYHHYLLTQRDKTRLEAQMQQLGQQQRATENRLFADTARIISAAELSYLRQQIDLMEVRYGELVRHHSECVQQQQKAYREWQSQLENVRQRERKCYSLRSLIEKQRNAANDKQQRQEDEAMEELASARFITRSR